ncbi:CYTH domain-containing protein [Jeotgalibacillus aurantiacus]|uniref:CYTH domain-containing protein n=1 Tax=Jeotgalibacillus aurantiacus TaxID=2763266 RepID=UPI001D0AD254|nr:CYTH domain-containing protein [Jeotgalibacillus aurantiacus]
MSQELEIEFKNLLTEDEYQRLLNTYGHTSPVKQVNHYFDTPLFHLKQAGAALRIREKDKRAVLTLKQPVEEGVLETHQVITSLDSEDMMNGGGLKSGEISDLLELLNIPVSDIIHFGSLTTERIETEYEGGLLVLDHSFYLNKEDFEVEYEVSDRQDGEKKFMSLLSSYEIPVRETDSKIKRFYKEKVRLIQSGR